MGIEVIKIKLPEGEIAAGGTALLPYPSGQAAGNYLTTGAKLTDNAGNIYNVTIALGSTGITVTNPTGRKLLQADVGYLQLTTDDVGEADSQLNDVVYAKRDASGNVTGLSVGGDVLPGSVELSGTFANKPLPSAVPIGTLYFATDAGISGSLWRNNGTAWKTINKSIPLLSYANIAGFSAAANSAEQIFSDVVFVPGGMIESGDKLQWVHFSEDTGTADTGSRTIRIRVDTDTAVISGGQIIAAIATSAAASNKIAGDKAVVILAGATKSPTSTSAGGVISATAWVTTTIDFSTDKYVGFTVQNANLLVPHTIYNSILTLEKGN